MIIYVKKTFLRIDRRTTQNYSSEPHKIIKFEKKITKKKCFLSGQTDRRTDRQTDTRSTQNYSSDPHKTSQKIFIIFIR
jgi:hypothetical protein